MRGGLQETDVPMTPGSTLRVLGLVVTVLAILLASGEAWVERRVAVMIGDSSYQYVTQLPNVVNDATGHRPW
jgi:hypothetical protein